MQTIALLNMKGGVGKTTLAVNLAWHAARTKKRVLLIDLDPQFNATQWLMNYSAFEKHRTDKGTVADLLMDAKKSLMTLKPKSQTPNLLSLLSTIDETGTDGRFKLLPAELDLARAVKNPQGVEYRLQKALDQSDKHFDYVFIDCAPTDTVLTATALTASNFVLVPVKPDRFSILGYGMMKRVFEEFRNDYPDPKKVRDLGVVFTRVAGNDAIEDDCKLEVAKEATYVFKAKIDESKSYSRAVHEQSPIFDTRHARSPTREGIGELFDEIENRITSLSKPKVAPAK